ncbi:MAG TPA: helix-turn-helix domain-containing protein [Candidatus Wunengus sp. YC60]|uniref:helix-turn-helix domain-containing protein n=1 Tax=Candidatus Wunengus sp. YC60 TaxID=3367697 RepID=UPI004024BDAB
MRKNPQKAFGDRVRDLRKQANLSQEKLAEISGLHRTYVGAVERGERNISLLNIIVLSRSLGVRPSYLLESIE